MKKSIFLIFLTLSLSSCSVNQTDNESEHNKSEVIQDLDEDEKNELERLAKHKDNGVYHYTTYDKDNGTVISEEVYGESDDYKFRIDNNEVYQFRDKKTSTIANSKNNLYYENILSDNSSEDDDSYSNFYNDLYQKGKFDLVSNSNYITLEFDNGDYRKYDANSLNLIEETFSSEGMSLIKILESHDSDVEKSYDKYFHVIENMTQTDDVGKVTENE